MTSRREAAQVLAMCQWVKRRLKAVEERAKTVADVSYPSEKTAATVDGTVVGYTQRVTRKPADPFVVLDRQGFVEWVEARWPSEVEKTVRPAFLSVLAMSAEQHDGIVIDDDGEVCPFVKAADPIVYTTTTLAKGSDELLEPLLAHRSLASLTDFIEDDSPDNPVVP